MFENDDWEIEEDYLTDFNSEGVLKDFGNEKKETETFLSKSEVKSVQKPPTNSQRLEFNVSEDSMTQTISQNVNTDSRKNVVLNIFKNNTEVKTNSTNTVSVQQNARSNSAEKSAYAGDSLNESRRNLILDVFKQNEVDINKSTVESSKPIVKSVLKITEAYTDEERENKLKRKKHVAFSSSTNEPNIVKKLCVSSTDKSSLRVSANGSNESRNVAPSTSFEGNKSKEADSRKQLLIELLKSPVKNARKSRIKQAVVRKFPGPAGLLPDDIDGSEVVDLEVLDENRNNKTNKYADICSQNTKNLFTTGAWQLMVDDLPSNFELCDIATVKGNALEYSRTYKKVPYVAGVIQHIDYKPNDPHVVLKDLSGKIDARIHHSICKLYPNSLGNNIVLLAKDVGLIVTSKKYVCIIISLKNLVSMYSDEARLVVTAHLEKLLDSNLNCNMNQSQISILDDYENHENTKSVVKSSKKSIPEAGSILKDKSNINAAGKKLSKENQPKLSNQIEAIEDFDFDEDDAWLSVNIDDLNSFKSSQFPSSTPLNVNKSTEIEGESSNKSNVISLKKYEWQKKVKPGMKKSNVPTSEANEILPDLKTNDVSSSNETATSNTIDLKTTKKNPAEPKKLNESISRKLAAFRSKHVVTPPPEEQEKHVEAKSSIGDDNHLPIAPSNSKNNFENKSQLSNNNLFGCDTDDEMLSQLDVDAIAATFSGQ